MTTHQLAAELLTMPDVTAVISTFNGDATVMEVKELIIYNDRTEVLII